MFIYSSSEVLKKRVANYVSGEKKDMEQKLALGPTRSVWGAIKYDGIFVTLRRFDDAVYAYTATGRLLCFCWPTYRFFSGLPEGVILRAELVMERPSWEPLTNFEKHTDTMTVLKRAKMVLPADTRYKSTDPVFKDIFELSRIVRDELGLGFSPMLYVHCEMYLEHDLRPDLIAQYLWSENPCTPDRHDAHPRVVAVEWTLVTSVDKELERLHTVWTAGHEGLMFFVVDSPEKPAGSSPRAEPPAKRSHFIKAKYRNSHTGEVVKTEVSARPHKGPRYTVNLHNGHQVHVEIGDIRDWCNKDRVYVDCVPKSCKDPAARHSIGMGRVARD